MHSDSWASSPRKRAGLGMPQWSAARNVAGEEPSVLGVRKRMSVDPPGETESVVAHEVVVQARHVEGIGSRAVEVNRPARAYRRGHLAPIGAASGSRGRVSRPVRDGVVEAPVAETTHGKPSRQAVSSPAPTEARPLVSYKSLVMQTACRRGCQSRDLTL